MMPNKDLLSPEQRQIVYLKSIIEKFKAYDKERTKEYHRLEAEVEALKKRKDSDYITELENKVQTYKAEVTRLNAYIRVQSIPTDIPEDSVKSRIIIQELKAQNQALTQRIRTMKNSLDSLLAQLNKAQ